MKKQPQKSQKSLKKKGSLTSDPPAPSAPVVAGPVIAPVVNAADQAKKLDEVGAQIARDKALKEKDAADIKAKEDLKLSPPAPSPLPQHAQGFSFELSPAFKKVGAGVSFYVLTWVVETFFKRGVKPLTDKQQAEVEAAVDRLAQKYMPLFMSKFMSEHQQESDLVCVLAGIGFENSAPLASKQAQPGPVDKPPTIPETPQAHVTVVTAEAPPLPGAS